MLRWENLCVPELWFGSTPFYSILIPRAIFPKYEGSCMVYRPKWYREKKYHQIPIAYWYQKIWNPHYRYLNGIYIYYTGPTLISISAISFMLTCVCFGLLSICFTWNNGSWLALIKQMILKTTCSWLALVLERFELYGDAEFDWSKGWVLNFITSIVQWITLISFSGHLSPRNAHITQ